MAVSSLGSRLSFRLTVLSEGGGVESERGGVNSDAGGVNSVGGGVSMEGSSWVPLAVKLASGSRMGVVEAIGGGVKTGSARWGAEFDRRPSVRESDVFSTRRHCMMLMSFPPVEIR